MPRTLLVSERGSTRIYGPSDDRGYAPKIDLKFIRLKTARLTQTIGGLSLTMSKSTTDTSHPDLESCFGPEQEGRVNEIARCMSRYSQDLEFTLDSTPTANGLHRSATRSPESYTTLEVEKGSRFDPFAPNFDSLAWAQRFMAVYRGDPDHNTLRSCGVAFRNVNVHGFGSDYQYQSTVGNLPLSLLGSLKNHLSPSARRKVSILKDFIGVVEQGEMLVVLGPPGR